MLTQDNVVEILANALKEHGPEEMRTKTYDEIVEEIKLGLSEAEEDGPLMVRFLTHMLNTAYQAGRQSALYQ